MSVTFFFENDQVKHTAEECYCCDPSNPGADCPVCKGTGSFLYSERVNSLNVHNRGASMLLSAMGLDGSDLYGEEKVETFKNLLNQAFGRARLYHEPAVDVGGLGTGRVRVISPEIGEDYMTSRLFNLKKLVTAAERAGADYIHWG